MSLLDDYRWLVSDAAKPWLSLASEESSPRTTVGLLSRLRRELSPEQSHLVVEQVQLRRRGREKFSRAGQMFFTRQGLEQATDEQIAAYKAGRFAEGGAIVDLCCGIGGDLIALCRRGRARGVDREPIMSLLAGANAAAHGLNVDQCMAVTEEALQFPIADAAWHCDPDRRPMGQRATRGDFFEPPLDRLAALISSTRSAAIKLAPATAAPDEWKAHCELEWLGSRGECRQQVAWFGDLARHEGQRSATIVGHSGETRTVLGDGDSSIPAPIARGRYLFEPDATVLAARLTGALCREHALAPIAEAIAYLTGDRAIQDTALDAFEIVDVLPLDRKQLKAYCREHRLGRLEIKKRGVDIHPQRLREEIISAADNEATILLAPLDGQARAIVARRVPTG